MCNFPTIISFIPDNFQFKPLKEKYEKRKRKYFPDTFAQAIQGVPYFLIKITADYWRRVMGHPALKKIVYEYGWCF